MHLFSAHISISFKDVNAQSQAIFFDVLHIFNKMPQNLQNYWIQFRFSNILRKMSFNILKLKCTQNASNNAYFFEIDIKLKNKMF